MAIISRRQQRSSHQQRLYCFWIMLLNNKPTNVLISLFVTNNLLRIDYALKEQHSLKRKNLLIMANKRLHIVQLKIKKSGDCQGFTMSKIIKRTNTVYTG